MRGWLFSVGWILVGLLCVSGLLISAGSQDQTTHPSPLSYTPSGTMALADLLRSRGYRVKIDPSTTPSLGKNQVALAFYDPGALSDDADTVKRHLEKEAEQGGTVIVLPFESDFPSASSSASNAVPATTSAGKSLNVNGSDVFSVPKVPGDSYNDDGAEVNWFKQPNGPTQNLLSINGANFCTATPTGSGYLVQYEDAIGLTNRFIDKNDNAQAFMGVLSAVAPKGATIKFATGTFGDAETPGLLETIGSWAQAAWWQALFVLGVIVVSLNRRFGYPTPWKPAQRGGRELLDAIADTFSRARSSQSALMAANASIDATLRRNLRLPRDASEGERDRALPSSLSQALSELQAAIREPKLPETVALQTIRKSEREVEAFLGSRRSSGMVRRRPKA